MSEEIINLTKLSSLVGLRVLFRGEPCLVVEVLETPPALVLGPEEIHLVIQADAYGRPSTMGRATYLVQVLTPDFLGLSDELLELELLD